MNPPPLKTVFVVPHTHWDREWYQQEHLFRHRLVEVVEQVLSMLESNPDFSVFLLDGQVGLVDDYLAVRPDDEPRICALARSGRLLLGPWYVLADEYLSSDESLVRNLLLGRVAGDRYGHWLPIGYCPDSFGHPATLPAILNGFGIGAAVLWRGVGGRPGETGDLFNWRSLEGSSVLVAHLAPVGYELGAELPVAEDEAAKRWKGLRDILQQRTVSGRALLPNGADHHAIQPDLIDALATFRRIAPTVEFQLASPECYFDDIPRDVVESLHAVRGELRFSYGYTWTLQGIHSTRSRIKRRAAEAERLLVRWAEPQCALAYLAAGTDRRPLLHDTWREFLRSSAHDSIGGCCSDPVARDVDQRFARAATAAQQLYVQAIWDRMQQDRVDVRLQRDAWSPRLVVVNPTPRQRTGIVETTVSFFRADVPVGRPPTHELDMRSRDKKFHLVAPDGQRVHVQITGGFAGYDRLDSPRAYPDQDLVDVYRVVFVGRAPPLGAVAYQVVEQSVTAVGDPPVAGSAVTVVPGMMTSKGLEVTSSKRGFAVSDHATRLHDVLDVVSEVDEGDTYTFQPGEKTSTLHAEWSGCRIVWRGPVVGCLARDFRIGSRAEGTVYARLDCESKVVHWIVEGVNHAGNHRLRVLFPLPADVEDHAMVDQHFGPICRSRETAHPEDFPGEHPVTSAPCHRFVSVASPTNGLTVFPRGAFEYELTDRHVAITVFRAVGELSKSDLPARSGHAGWPVATPDAQELGHFRLEVGSALVGVTLDAGVPAWDELERLAETFHAPLSGVMLRHAVQPPDELEGPILSGEGLSFKSLKPAEHENAVVFRCVNVTNHATKGIVAWPHRMERAARCRMDEAIEHDMSLDAGRRVAFDAAPHEIVSLIFWI